MNWIQKTAIFIGLSIAFLFAIAANKTVVNTIQVEKSNSSISLDSIHSSVFIQPQASVTIVSPQKTPNFSILKYFENYLVVVPILKNTTSFSLFENQDINLHKKVSLLLYPFHYFW